MRLLLLLSQTLILIQALLSDRSRYRNVGHKSGKIKLNSNIRCYSEEWLADVPIDHFSFANDHKFKLRYFINTTNFIAGGPIFFWTGHEADLEFIVEHNNWLLEIAPEFNAAVVYAEHRYYGKTLPFGNESFTSIARSGYLTSEQALADYVILIDSLKTTRLQGARQSPVIAFGGSYAGMLSAWLRTKYPHKVDGAISSSAPLFGFGYNNTDAYYGNEILRTLGKSGCDAKELEKKMNSVLNLAKTKKGRHFLNKRFHLDSQFQLYKEEDAKKRIEFVFLFALKDVVLSDDPLGKAKKTCSFLKQVATSDEEAASQIFKATGYVHSITDDSFNTEPDETISLPEWFFYQMCTEMALRYPKPVNNSRGENIFSQMNFIGVDEDRCEKELAPIGYNRSMIRYNWVQQQYGDLKHAFNIVFSNGEFDPWSGAGWSRTEKREGSLVSLIIRGGGHHHDTSKVAGKASAEVQRVRNIEKAEIRKWIAEAKSKIGIRSSFEEFFDSYSV